MPRKPRLANDGRFRYNDHFGYNDDGWLDPHGHLHDDSSRWVNPQGQRREKHDERYKYCYDEFFLFGGAAAVKTATGADYSDRLVQWDYQKYERLAKKHFSGRPGSFSELDAATLSAFMSEYHDAKLEVVAFAEGCNPSSGYPYWIIWHKGERK